MHQMISPLCNPWHLQCSKSYNKTHEAIWECPVVLEVFCCDNIVMGWPLYSTCLVDLVSHCSLWTLLRMVHKDCNAKAYVRAKQSVMMPVTYETIVCTEWTSYDTLWPMGSFNEQLFKHLIGQGHLISISIRMIIITITDVMTAVFIGSFGRVVAVKTSC